MISVRNSKIGHIIGALIPDNQVTQFSERQEFLDSFDKQLLSYLDTNTLFNLAYVNKNSYYPNYKIHPTIKKEIQRRTGCVTIYTWPVAENSSARTGGRMGHSALKTWSGGENDEGIYASFYPANHHCCEKPFSHFHKWNHPREIIEDATRIDLYTLEVKAINKAFDCLHDDMKSYKPWSTRYNCSDVVLFLLEEGGISEKFDFNITSTLTTALTSIIHSTLLRALYESLFRIKNVKTFVGSKPFLITQLRELSSPSLQNKEQLRNMVRKLLSKDSISLVLYPLMNKSVSYFEAETVAKSMKLFSAATSITRCLLSGLLNVPMTCFSTYVFSHISLTKKYKSPNIVRKIAKQNAIKTAAIIALEPLVTSGIASILCTMGFKRAEGYNFVGFNLLGFNSLEKLISLTGFNLHLDYLMTTLSSKVVTINPGNTLPKPQSSPYLVINYKNPTFKENGISFSLISYPIILGVCLLLSSRYLYDTTTTPKHVLNVSEEAKAQFNSHKPKAFSPFMGLFTLRKNNQSVAPIINNQNSTEIKFNQR